MESLSLASGASTPPPVSASGDGAAAEKIITESVDVYLLAPEDDREIEIKDFTIMKPKNNKMHRLVRYYPRCEISYRAVPPPPPEERVVTSPNGTNTTTITTSQPRHNGGFSNPSRNAEVFRLKRKLLQEYMASMQREASLLSPQDDPLRSSLRATYRRPASPPSWGAPSGSAIPTYRRVPLGDEDVVPLTSELTPKMSWKARVNYISSLWPDVAPVDDDEDIMEYYGLEVQIISDEQRKKELEALKAEEEKGEASPTRRKEQADAKENGSGGGGSTLEKEKDKQDQKQEQEQEEEVEEEEDAAIPERTVETRSAAKMKDAEHKISPTASKQDDWVQCDKCQKWRRLPNHVNVSELPATWYCKMNRWDKRFNKCSAPEEKVAVPMKPADLVEFRERKFAGDLVQRLKRMEKALHHYKFSDAREDSGERQVVQCVECFKQRPLIAGMDKRKVAQPFVCWMNNWDELHASCSAPQGAIPPRPLDGAAPNSGSSGAGGTAGAAAGEPSGAKKAGAGQPPKPAKRKPSEPPSSASSHSHSQSAGNSATKETKRPKRR
ncbi:hypothetical protein P43SY_009703 [Pythium insidiosum]|uniref:CW-type domain-containing protein n=1 Tax=Pythium insidiosum TaxID=114742 RepID=A0AAD5LYH3_PYTIN|nr:hypothetical protein P43SY_009703 [Pythium insidiosum]